MKIAIEIDCSPEEARRLLGLPDVAALNEAMTAALHERMAEAAANLDLDAMMRQWMEGGLKGAEQWQKAFFAQMKGGGGKGGD